MSKFYAVSRGRNPGIYDSWVECSKQISGRPNSLYKAFHSKETAEKWLKQNSEVVKVDQKAAFLNSIDRTDIYIEGLVGNRGCCYGVLIADSSSPKELSGVIDSSLGKNGDYAKLYAIAVAILNTKEKINIFIGSQYLIDLLTKYVNEWISNGWITSTGTPVPNRDLIEYIHNLLKVRDVKFYFVTNNDSLELSTRTKALTMQHL